MIRSLALRAVWGGSFSPYKSVFSTVPASWSMLSSGDSSLSISSVGIFEMDAERMDAERGDVFSGKM